jgi:hypothetical protein
MTVDGPFWTKAVRENPHLTGIEAFGIPVDSRNEYIRWFVNQDTLPILAIKEVKRIIPQQLSVEHNGKEYYDQYDTRVLLFLIPTACYDYYPENVVQVPIYFGESEGGAAKSPFSADHHRTVPINLITRGLKYCQAHAEPDEYIANLPVKVSVTALKAFVQHGIKTRPAQEFADKGSNPGKVHLMAYQIEIFSERVPGTNGMIYSIRAATKKGLRMARQAVKLGINVMGKRITLANKAAATELDKQNFLAFDKDDMHRQVTVYTDKHTPDPTVIEQHVDYLLGVEGAVAVVTPMRHWKVNKYGFGRSTFISFTTTRMREAFMALATTNGGYLDIGVGQPVKVRLDKAPGDHNSQAPSVGEDTGRAIEEPDEELYAMDDDDNISVVTMDDLNKADLTLSDEEPSDEEEELGEADEDTVHIDGGNITRIDHRAMKRNKKRAALRKKAAERSAAAQANLPPEAPLPPRAAATKRGVHSPRTTATPATHSDASPSRPPAKDHRKAHGRQTITPMSMYFSP